MELRTVVSLLITRFDISFAPGDDGSSLMENTLDTFTVRLGDLNLVFSERRSKKVSHESLKEREKKVICKMEENDLSYY